MNRAFITGQLTSAPRPKLDAAGEQQIGFQVKHKAGEIEESTYVVCRNEIAEYVSSENLLDGRPYLIISGVVEVTRNGVVLIAEHIAKDNYPTWRWRRQREVKKADAR